jgi:HAD superfamily hydrolase (TIGR01509 family)
MDGLLVDTEPLWLETEIGVTKRLGGTPWTAQDQLQLLGGSLSKTVRYLLDRATVPASPEAVGEWMMDGVESLVRSSGVPLQPGARELHQALRGEGVPIGLVTSSQRSFMRAVLETIDLDFDITVCAQDVTQTKPAPEPYQLAAKLFGVQTCDCVVLEDSPNGVAAGEAAGCAVVAVPSFVSIEPAPGRLVLSSLEEVGVPLLRSLV